MANLGGQQFWLAGSRFYFKRDDINAVEQPWIDLGIIQPANPTLDIEEVEIYDSDGGVKTLADSQITKFTETYELVCSNLNGDNLALLFYANPPTAFSQTATEKTATIGCFPGRLFKIHDTDTAETPLFSLGTIAGVYTGATLTAVLTDITVSTKTLKVTGDITLALAPGDPIIVHAAGLTNIANSRTYKHVSDSFAGGATSIVVEETPAANEVAIVGQVRYEGGGTIYLQGTDWEVVDLDRGLGRMINGGAFAVSAALSVLFTPAVITSSLRLINPQNFEGKIQGIGMLFWGRENNAFQTVREATVILSPSASAIGVDDYSNMTIKAKVVSDITATIPAGRLLGFKGALPLPS